MRSFTVAAIVLALVAVPAAAQRGRPPQQDDKQSEKKPQVDDKAYKAALDRIPEPKDKYDPWSITKPAAPAAPAKKPK